MRCKGFGFWSFGFWGDNGREYIIRGGCTGFETVILGMSVTPTFFED